MAIRFGISQKLTLNVVGLVFIALMALTFTARYLVRDLTTPMVKDALFSNMANDRNQFYNYLRRIEQDMELWSTLPVTQQALKGFSAAWQELDGDPMRTLQRLYIDDNPAATGNKDTMDDARDGSAYSMVHAQVHETFREFMIDRGYYDIFLIDNDGNIVYSVYKELDYATNLIDGNYAKSGLGQVFRESLETENHDSSSFVDFAPYAPSAGAPASFIAQPVIDAKGQQHGVLAFQMPLDRLNDRVGDRGNGVHAMIVGTDQLIRSQDDRYGKDTALVLRVDNIAAKRALNGETGTIISETETGHFVKAYSPIEFKGVTWAFITEQDRDLAFATVLSMERTLFTISGVMLIIALLFGLRSSRQIGQPIKAMVRDIQELARGNTDHKITVSDRHDEIGEVQAALKDMTSALQMNATAAQEIANGNLFTHVSICSQDDKLGKALQKMLDKLTEILTGVGIASEHVANDAESLNGTANTLSKGTSEQAEAAQIAAAAVEQMSANIRQSTSNAQKTEKIAAKSAASAKSSGEVVGKAVASMKSIAEKISVVQEIARKTDLLALNAAVEAARAGEHGKGFAVVASEVRKLAERSQSAASEISELSGATVDASKNAGVVLEQLVPDIQHTADLVKEISASMNEQNTGAEQLNQSIRDLDKVIQHNADSARTTLENASSLSTRSADLNSEIGYFKLEPTSQPNAPDTNLVA